MELHRLIDCQANLAQQIAVSLVSVLRFETKQRTEQQRNLVTQVEGRIEIEQLEATSRPVKCDDEAPCRVAKASHKAMCGAQSL